MKKVVFVFDYVMHYHRDLLRAVERDVKKKGGTFVLLTARHAEQVTGRTPLPTKVVDEQGSYSLYERGIGGFTLRNQSHLLSMIRSLKPDIVVTMCHAGTISEWRLALQKKALGFKLIAWQCGYEYNPGRFKDMLLSRFVPLFDHHLAYHSNAKCFAMKYGASEDQVTVIHNTIDEERIVPMAKDAARQRIDAQFPSLTGRQVALYVGAVLLEKRLDTVLDALDYIGDGRIGFLIVGDGPHLRELRSRCAGRDDVAFAGRIVEGVGPYFDGADMFVLPGTGGLALNEAMAHGLPLISGYADGSADDLVQDGVNGFRLRRGDGVELANRLAELADDAVLRARMGLASRELASTLFSFQMFVQRVTDALDTL